MCCQAFDTSAFVEELLSLLLLFIPKHPSSGRNSVHVCVRARARARACVCVCERERERERTRTLNFTRIVV